MQEHVLCCAVLLLMDLVGLADPAWGLTFIHLFFLPFLMIFKSGRGGLLES